ncbi:xanthine dehydrogenase family protein subunit M [Thiomonas sp. FB-6]|uniref:FAD binding domain-containing protein n=1 Tax=Thiomonas sp. FB-6 TaxID=1158291 RepID=UPI00037AD2F9|nr:FAD binding domain-containing protein [Thiomonas sp. FB-6]
MKPCRFDYLRAETASEAVECLAQFGEDARVLAGGQSLMPILNMRLAQPGLLLDISRTRDLDYVRVHDAKLRIGAAATQASVEWRPGLASEVPLLHAAFPSISHFQIRNRGTVCGSVAHADPSAELPLVLLALGGEVVLRSARSRRVVTAQDFFRGMLQTARAADELVEEVRYPLARDGEGYGFLEFANRHGDFAIVAVAVVARAGGIDVAVGGVADRPRLKHLPRAGAAELDQALNDFAWELQAQDDAQASAKFRRHLVRRLGRRAIEEALA